MFQLQRRMVSSRSAALVRLQKRLPSLRQTATYHVTTAAIRRRHKPFPAIPAAASAAALLGATISTTWCQTTQQSQESKEYSTAELIVPSLQALLRALRLLKTTGLIVLDYEMHKWQQQLKKFFQQTAGRSRKSVIIPENGDLSHLSQEDLVDYWEEEVQRRHDVFEKAQNAYTTPTSRQNKPSNVSDDEWKRRQKQEMKDAVAAWLEAEDELKKVGGSHKSQVHSHAAERLVELCRTNAGVYIKIGQHLANMDYLIPQEYIDGLSCLLDDAPTSSFEAVASVIEEDLGKTPEELFDNFDASPIASASLAQVHVAYDKSTGRKLAIKVQHKGLRETCRGDIVALHTVVRLLESFFEDFNFGWIADEIAPQLPKELDFQNEGKNSEIAASFIQQRQHKNNDVIIPKVHWEHTTNRVLCMEFEEGFRATDIDRIREAKMNPRDVAELVSRVFNSQIFLDAWVHCDPHPANVLLRKNAKTGKPQMVLIDHGLYKQLDDDFRVTYAELWKALMNADIPKIKKASQALGVDGMMYTLLSGLLTARPFDEVVARSKTGSFDLSQKQKADKKSPTDKAVIRGYAQKFLVDILTMIDKLPRQMILLLKVNDCLRHIDYALGSPTNTLVVSGRLAAQAVYEHKLQENDTGVWTRIGAWLDYVMVMWKIRLYELGSWWTQNSGRSVATS